MYPRLPRLLRLALLALCLVLSLLVVLRVGGGLQGHSSPDLLRSAHRLASSQGLQRPVLSSATARRPLVPPPHPPSPTTLSKLKLVQVLRVNKTLPPISSLVKTTAPSKMTASPTKTTPKPANVVNPHPFNYIINPRDACRRGKDGHVDLLVYIHSAPANFKKRMAIRQTWGDKALLDSYNATLVFLMGQVPDTAYMTLLKMESEQFQDIVQEDFLDTYRNLSYKAIAGLKWATHYCPGISYILKTDDDILVNLPRVIRYIREEVQPKFGSKKQILCNVWIRMRIIRDVRSKWYVSEKEMKGDVFSPYCSGSAFILSGDMAKLLFETSLVTPFFWVDDFYITGALVQRLQIKHRSLNRAYLLNPGLAEAKFRNDSKKELFFFHLHKLIVMYRIWKQMNPVNATSPSTPPHNPHLPHHAAAAAAHSVRPVPHAA